jgi:hypothetical protein
MTPATFGIHGMAVTDRAPRSRSGPHLYGRWAVTAGSPPALTDLGLYSITFANDPATDREALEHYRAFRIEAEQWDSSISSKCSIPTSAMTNYRVAASKRYGARLVLFGRKINLAEDLIALIALMQRAKRPSLQATQSERIDVEPESFN